MAKSLNDDGEKRVSIVMAAYNAAATIERSIVSIQLQSYPHWELWVVDDGSQDETATIVSAFSSQDSRIRLIQQANAGTASARNRGLEVCNGEWIAFLDADDRWLPGKLAADIHTLRQQHDPVGVAYSWYYAVDEYDHLVTLSPAYAFTGHAFHDVLARESLLLPSTTMLHHSILTSSGLFLTNHIHEDREFFLRVCKQFPIYPTMQRLILYQQSAQGKCRALLNDYDRAVHAELSIVDSVAHLLTPEEVDDLCLCQKRNLFYRFLMYNHETFAGRLRKELPTSLLQKDKKGWLTLVWTATSINMLALARCIIQGAYRWLLNPWWQQQLKQMTTPPPAA